MTGKPLDLALNGKGFFAVNGPAGALYTRNGAFQISNTGDVVTRKDSPYGLLAADRCGRSPMTRWRSAPTALYAKAEQYWVNSTSPIFQQAAW